MGDMKENELKVFTEAVTHYFAQRTADRAGDRASQLAEVALPRLDFPGSGQNAGQLAHLSGWQVGRPHPADYFRMCRAPAEPAAFHSASAAGPNNTHNRENGPTA